MSSLNRADSCLSCNLRTRSFFCDLSPSSLAAFNHIKHAAVFPEHSVVLVEGQNPRGVFMFAPGAREAFDHLAGREDTDCPDRRGRRGSGVACRHYGWSLRTDGGDDGAVPVGFRGDRR